MFRHRNTPRHAFKYLALKNFFVKNLKYQRDTMHYEL
jgi:hypothetical protein